MLVLTDESRVIAGILLLTIVTIEFGGWIMTKIVDGGVPMTDFQKTFARAGHAHAGVLVTLGLVCQLLADAASVTRVIAWVGRLRAPLAAARLWARLFASSPARD